MAFPMMVTIVTPHTSNRIQFGPIYGLDQRHNTPNGLKTGSLHQRQQYTPTLGHNLRADHISYPKMRPKTPGSATASVSHRRSVPVGYDGNTYC